MKSITFGFPQRHPILATKQMSRTSNGRHGLLGDIELAKATWVSTVLPQTQCQAHQPQ